MPYDPYALLPFCEEDRAYAGSRFSEVRDAVFANPYQHVWGGEEEPPLPYRVPSFFELLRGVLPYVKPERYFRRAAERAVDSHADLRWGRDRMGYRRLIHPNGVCLSGLWEIEEDAGYTGYFRKGSRGLVIARYSAPGAARRGEGRGQAMAAKLFPTANRDHSEPLRTAHFFMGDDISGTFTPYVNDIALTNAPNVTPENSWSSGPVLLLCFVLFKLVDLEPTIRQLHQIAELGEPEGAEIRAPGFMRLRIGEGHPRIEGDGLDLRDEIMALLYDRGDPKPKRKLVYDIDVTDDFVDHGLLAKRREFSNWRRVGRLTFDEATISYNGDHVLHFTHPGWRSDRNNPETAIRPAYSA